MELDILIPFAILLVLVIYLIYTRGKFEKKIVETYEQKFEQWKKHSKVREEKVSSKELIGLVFKKDYKISIELLDKDMENRLRNGKFDIKNLKDN